MNQSIPQTSFKNLEILKMDPRFSLKIHDIRISIKLPIVVSQCVSILLSQSSSLLKRGKPMVYACPGEKNSLSVYKLATEEWAEKQGRKALSERVYEAF